jgi:hypothetical protein
MYTYFYRCKVRVCKWVRVRVLAHACDRVRALTMRECAACVRVRRALFVRPSIDGTRTGIVYRCTMHACLYIHARLATPMNGSPMRSPPHTRALVLRPCARVCAIGRPRIRAGTCERVPSAWTACGSARRRSRGRRRSTRTSAPGTPRPSPRWPGYAPPLRPPAGRARPGGRCGAGCCARRHRRKARAGVCADVYARARSCVHECRYSGV